MNKIANKFLLAGNKFKPEVYLRQPRFACSTCGSFTKNKEGIQKFKAAGGDSQYIYQKKKTSFQHDTAYGDFKDLPQRTASDETLCNETFNIARNLKHDGIKEVLF